MKRFFFLTVFLSYFLFSGSADAEQRFVYVSAGGAVTAYSVDLATGKLTEIQKNPGAGLSAVTSNQKRLFRIGGEEVETYAIQKNGKLRSLGKESTEGKAGYLGVDATDRFLAGSNYGGGSVSVWRIGEDGIAKGTPVSEMMLEKAAHSSVFSPNNQFLLVPATTPNKVFQINFDSKTGALTPNEVPFASGPTPDGENATQPRHLIFHPGGKIAYTTLERENPGVGVWSWDSETGQLEVVQNLVSRPEDFEGSMTTADLHLTPDGKFLYVSNRDLTDRKAITGNSSIAAFSVDEETGRLTLIGHTHCENVPRGFRIDQAGEFMYVAGQNEGKLGVYRINQETGALDRVQQIETGKGPNWVVCVTRN